MQIHTMMKLSYMEIMCVSSDFFFNFYQPNSHTQEEKNTQHWF